MNTKRKLSFSAFISTFVIVLLFSLSINAVYAYFSATAQEEYKLKFATLTIDIKDSSNNSATRENAGYIEKSAEKAAVFSCSQYIAIRRCGVRQHPRKRTACWWSCPVQILLQGGLRRS